MSNVRDQILDYIKAAQGKALQAGEEAVLAACDIAYSRHLMGLPAFESAAAFEQYIALLASCRLAGTPAREAPSLNVHLTAYALATLNLAETPHGATAKAFVQSQDWRWDLLIDPATLLPRWPWKYTHHSWRVSHWVGGAPSIIKSLWRIAPDLCAARGVPATADVLAACDALVDGRTGLLRTYKSDLIQFCFRQLYRLRHDPDAGDVGGIVHLHWVNYAEGRLPYKAHDGLYARSWKLMQRKPFIEKVPYCLDFDIVQIVRTTAPAGAPLAPEVLARAGEYAADILGFFKTGLNDGYALHKLPGALATVHECALIRNEAQPPELGAATVDIIKDAFWI